MVAYRPRRATQRWQQDAPEFVLDVFDAGDKQFDRYTVLFGGSLLEPELLKHRSVYYLGLSSNPTHPQGFSQWGECSASYRPAHQRIRWLDLPEPIRQHVIARATAE